MFSGFCTVFSGFCTRFSVISSECILLLLVATEEFLGCTAKIDYSLGICPACFDSCFLTFINRFFSLGLVSLL